MTEATHPWGTSPKVAQQRHSSAVLFHTNPYNDTVPLKQYGAGCNSSSIAAAAAAHRPLRRCPAPVQICAVAHAQEPSPAPAIDPVHPLVDPPPLTGNGTFIESPSPTPSIDPVDPPVDPPPLTDNGTVIDSPSPDPTVITDPIDTTPATVDFPNAPPSSTTEKGSGAGKSPPTRKPTSPSPKL